MVRTKTNSSPDLIKRRSMTPLQVSAEEGNKGGKIETENGEAKIREFKMQSDEMTKPIMQNISASNLSDVVKLFLIFSRFEYALKRSGYVRGELRYAAPDWEAFGKCKSVKTRFESLKEKCGGLEKAIQYLKSKPPRIQIQRKMKLDWTEKALKKGDMEGCIDAVKRVRNNLFHGGKYPYPSGPVEDPTRNPKLIRHSITVLKYLLHSSPEVKRLYKEPVE